MQNTSTELKNTMIVQYGARQAMNSLSYMQTTGSTMVFEQFGNQNKKGFWFCEGV